MFSKLELRRVSKNLSKLPMKIEESAPDREDDLRVGLSDRPPLRGRDLSYVLLPYK
jgi:hypothetical protein